MENSVTTIQPEQPKLSYIDLSTEIAELIRYIQKVVLTMRSNSVGWDYEGRLNLYDERSENIYWLTEHLDNIFHLADLLQQDAAREKLLQSAGELLGVLQAYLFLGWVDKPKKGAEIFERFRERFHPDQAKAICERIIKKLQIPTFHTLSPKTRD